MSAALILFLAAAMGTGVGTGTLAKAGPGASPPVHIIPCSAPDAVAQMGGTAPVDPSVHALVGRNAAARPEPKLVRIGFDPETLRGVQFFCADDQILNPIASGRVVILIIDGKPVRFEPSPKAQSIVAPVWWSRIASLPEQIRHLFGGHDDGYHRFKDAILRGYGDGATEVGTAGGLCWLVPGVSTTRDNFVLETEQVVHIGFSCAPGTPLPHLTVTSRTGRRPLMLVDSAVSVSLARDCVRRCEVAVSGADGAALAIVRLLPVLRTTLDREDAALLDDPGPMGGAVLGLRLYKQPDWALGGASMLWSRACTLPAAAGVAAPAYHVAPEVFCKGGQP